MTDTNADPNVPIISKALDARMLSDTAGISIQGTESRSLPLRTIQYGKEAAASAIVIDIDRLYGAPAGSGSLMIRALGLLADAVERLDEARVIAERDAIAADRLTQRVQLILNDLFLCRKLGEGFGLIINSLHFSFVNLDGTPPNRTQLNVIWRVLKALRSRPALTFDEGLRYVEELEEGGLQVDPPVLAELLEHDVND